MRFTDQAVFDQDKTRTLDGGYLVAVARSVRTGIQDYLGSEVGKPDMPIVRVYRAPEEVFSDASLQSFSHAPITDDHPSEMVDSGNWLDLAKGEVSTAAKKDGEWVMLPLIFKDQAVIDKLQSGKRQLSAGYTCELVWGDGVTPEGEHYDARQTNIRINHLALVDKARAGDLASINDGAGYWGVSPHKPLVAITGDSHMTGIVLQKVMFDGLQIETTDQGAQVITKLQGMLADAKVELNKVQAQADADKKAHETALGTKDAEIKAISAKVLDEAALDKLATARGDLVAQAKAILPTVATDGVPTSGIKKAVVDAKDPTIAADVAGKPQEYADAYYDAMFKRLLAELGDAGELHAVLSNPARIVDTTSGEKLQDEAFQKSVTDLNAWRTAK